MEPLLNPARVEFRWWTNCWPLIWQLEHHASAADQYFQRLPPRFAASNPALRGYLSAWSVPLWDVMGWQSEAEGPWRARRLVALFPRPPWRQDPTVLCLDGPTDSLHRNGPLELCLYYVRDPEERSWKVCDGLIRLFDLARVHLWCEHIWRLRGRSPRAWPMPQAAHGYGTPAAPRPDLLLAPEVPLTATGCPTGPVGR